MRTCLHCLHEGPDETFSFYTDKKGDRRPRNICLACQRLHAADRQARYKEKHGDRIREDERNRRRERYHSDPKFRQKCIDDATERNRYERKKTSDSK